MDWSHLNSGMVIMTNLTMMPLDLEGVILENRRTDDYTLVKVNNKNNRATVLQFGPFYRDYINIIDIDRNIPLQDGVDYTCTYLYRDLSRLTSKEICGIIVITNPAVSNRIRITSRHIGGGYAISSLELIRIFEELGTGQLSFTWESIRNKPKQFPAEEHMHKFFQVYGLEHQSGQLKRIKKAIESGDHNAVKYDTEYTDYLYNLAVDDLMNLDQRIKDHIADTNNPHGSNKTKIGLSNIFNFAPSTVPLTIQGLSTNHYLRLDHLYEALVENHLPSLHAHLGDFTNPHGTHAELIGAPTYAQVDDGINGRLSVNGTAVNSLRFNGMTFTQLYNDFRQNLSADSVTDGIFNPNRLGSGFVANRQQMLVAGNWEDTDSVMSRFKPPETPIYYMFHDGTAEEALEVIEVVYADIDQYPPGVLVVFTAKTYIGTSAGNATSTFILNQFSAAYRTQTGWTIT